jgi:uncharacterized Zn-binding protein involved in type VI secretion
MKIGVNPPKTPVTQGSSDVAAATLPNVCKMPGPPAPFVPTPLPNIGKSGDRLKKCTTKVLFHGKKVAIEGSYYMSMGDIASKATGGGLISGSTHGKTEFTAPGSTNVKAQGKNIQLLGDAMTNNGNSIQSGTIPGNVQVANTIDELKALVGDTTAAKLCEAACEAIKKKKPNNKYQNLMRQALDPRKNGSRGNGGGLSGGMTNQVLTEVGQVVAKGGGSFIGRWGSAVRAALDLFVKWDIILVKGGIKLGAKGLSSFGQIKKIVEVKFPGDSPTVNQGDMMKKLGKKNGKKVVVMDVEGCCMPCPP